MLYELQVTSETIDLHERESYHKQSKKVSTLPLKEARIETTGNRFINLSEKVPFLQNPADGT